MSISFLIVAALTISPVQPGQTPSHSQGATHQSQHISRSTVTRSTVVGEWQMVHPKWKGTMNFAANGRFSRPHGDGGKWQLKIDGDRTVLYLDWDSWAPETAVMVAPDYFRGNTSDGQFELRRPTPERRETADAPEPPKGFYNPELKSALSGSTWEMKDGKRFTLQADGSTTANWHERKGYWRIVGPKTIELKIWWKPRPAEQLSVDADAKVLRWNDEAFGGIAKRVDEVHDARERNQP